MGNAKYFLTREEMQKFLTGKLKGMGWYEHRVRGSGEYVLKPFLVREIELHVHFTPRVLQEDELNFYKRGGYKTIPNHDAISVVVSNPLWQAEGKKVCEMSFISFVPTNWKTGEELPEVVEFVRDTSDPCYKPEDEIISEEGVWFFIKENFNKMEPYAGREEEKEEVLCAI